jgi:hypothetical protein
LLQRFATKQAQKSPSNSIVTGAIMRGGEREPHRLLPAPSALSANVFASLTAHQFTVNGFKMSTVLSTLLQRLGSL